MPDDDGFGSDIGDSIDLPESLDEKRLHEIMIYRSLGYNQTEIADEVGVTQKTVSRYLSKIKERSKEHGSPSILFYSIFLTMIASNIVELLGLVIEMTDSSNENSLEDFFES